MSSTNHTCLDSIQTLLPERWGRQGGVVIVSGPEGSGKTGLLVRLVEAACTEVKAEPVVYTCARRKSLWMDPAKHFRTAADLALKVPLFAAMPHIVVVDEAFGLPVRLDARRNHLRYACGLMDEQEMMDALVNDGATPPLWIIATKNRKSLPRWIRHAPNTRIIMTRGGNAGGREDVEETPPHQAVWVGRPVRVDPDREEKKILFEYHSICDPIAETHAVRIEAGAPAAPTWGAWIFGA